MKVTIDIPDRDYWQAAAVAERQGVRVADMVGALVEAGIHAATEPRETVLALVRAGYPDGEISKRTGMTVLTISGHRRALGLPPNRRAVWERQQRAAAAAERQVA